MDQLSPEVSSGSEAISGEVDRVEGVVKASVKLVADTGTKQLVVFGCIIAIGIVLIELRNAVCEASAWSSVYLTSGFLAWDAWVVYTDITDATTNLMIAAIKGIVDVLDSIGLDLPHFSMASILRSVEGPIIPPNSFEDIIENVRHCTRLDTGAETFSFAAKSAASNTVCPVLRYYSPTAVGPVLEATLGWLSYDYSPDSPKSCACDPAQFPCDTESFCLVLNSGFFFTEILAPLFVIAIIVYYMIVPVVLLVWTSITAIAWPAVEKSINAFSFFAHKTIGTLQKTINVVQNKLKDN